MAINPDKYVRFYLSCNNAVLNLSVGLDIGNGITVVTAITE